MRTPTQALLWRQWRMLRWPFLVVTVAAPATLASEWATHLWLGYGGYGGFAGVVMIMGMTVLMAMALSNGADIGNRSLAFPWALFTLPLRTPRLVALEYLGRVAIVAVALFTTIGSAFAVIRYNHPDSDAASFWLLSPFLLTSLFALFQGIAWWRGGMQVATIALMLGIPWSFARDLVAASVQGFAAASALQQCAMMMCALVAGYVVALPAVMRERSGARRESKTIGRTAPHAAIRFSSPEQAQRWYEWRKTYRYLLRTALLFFALSALVAPGLASAFGVRSNVLSWMSFVAFLIGGVWGLPMAAFVWGALSASAKWNPRTPQEVFVFTRPITTRTLARIRLQAAGRALFVSMGVLLAASIAYFFLTNLIGIAIGDQMPPVWGQARNLIYNDIVTSHGVLFFAILAVLYIGTCWMLMSGGTFFVAAAAIGLPTAIAQLVKYGLDGEHYSSPTLYTTFAFAIAGLFLCVPIAGLLWLARADLRRQLLSRKTVAAHLALWAGLTYLVTTFANFPNSLPSIQLDSPYHVSSFVFCVLTAIAVATLPVYPFVLEPLLLHRQRHR